MRPAPVIHGDGSGYRTFIDGRIVWQVVKSERVTEQVIYEPGKGPVTWKESLDEELERMSEDILAKGSEETLENKP